MPSIDHFWNLLDFSPNDAQRQAILHVDGPLYLPAGPGSGKTRVLLWRTFNLIVFHGVAPDRIFLSTFTQKAAKQLQDGLQTLLSYASEAFNRPYEINDMYIGTIHSLCQKILQDRRFSSERKRARAPVLMDELSQFFYLYQNKGFKDVLVPELAQVADPQVLWSRINDFLGKKSSSKFEAVSKLITFFNRISEEAPILQDWKSQFARLGGETAHTDFLWLIGLYENYQQSLQGPPRRSDLSLLQQEALRYLENCDLSQEVFQHIIIDEYQDTNSVQERLVFKLARKHQNLCVVGDDDQALYRFRGATVENFVQFPARVERFLKCAATIIPLSINYRSEKDIVHQYSTFMDTIDWSVAESSSSYRVAKQIQAHKTNPEKRVFKNVHGDRAQTVPAIVEQVQALIETKVVQDPSQIAFLFSSLGGELVKQFQTELESKGFKVYAPRANSFLETPEAKGIFGLLALILGEYKPKFKGRDIAKFKIWTEEIVVAGQKIIDADPLAQAFVSQKQAEIETIKEDHAKLMAVIENKKWDLSDPIDTNKLRILQEISKLSTSCRKTLGGKSLYGLIHKRSQAGNPLSVRYVVSSATALDWTLLDIFYRFCGLKAFKTIIEESSADEGPLYNLAYVGRYINKYAEEYKSMITAFDLQEKRLVNSLFGSYLFILYRKREREFENEDEPFPKGRIPFLTIHQSKGLEFPVVVLGSLKKIERIPVLDEILQPVLPDKEALDLQPRFDAMRKFYVAMSRAEKLLIIHDASRYISADFQDFVATIPNVDQLDVTSLPPSQLNHQNLPKSYSFTGDFNFYRQCPLQYQIFKKFAFPPSRSQTMAFGALVHQTLEDLHEFLISRKEASRG